MAGIRLLHALRAQQLSLTQHARTDGVGEFVLVFQRRHLLHGGIKQANDIGECIAKKARHTQRHIDPRTPHHRHGQHFEITDAPAAIRPGRAHAQQGQGLGDIVAAGAHGGRAPDRQADGLRIFTMLLRIFFHQQIGGFQTQSPARRRGDGARIDREKIAPGGQHIGPATRGGTAGAGRNKAPGQTAHQLQQLLRATLIEARAQVLLHALQHGLGLNEIRF